MKNRTAVITLALSSALAFVSASAQETVLREGQVSEKLLIDALAPKQAAATPEEAASGAEGVRTRSFRPVLRPAAAAAGTAATAAQPARASILVTFITNSSDLTADAKKALDVLAGAMKNERLAGVKFTIEGHADPRGSDELNLRLSQSRAESVRGYLTTSHGLSPERINAVGKGSTALMNPNDPTAPENRRVTIVAQPN